MLRKFGFKLGSQPFQSGEPISWSLILSLAEAGGGEACGKGENWSKDDIAFFLTWTQRKRGWELLYGLSKGGQQTHIHSQTHHRLPTAKQLATTGGFLLKRSCQKSGHEAFPCKGSKEGIWGLSMRIWGRLQPHKQLWVTECLLSSLAPAAHSDHSSNRLALNEMMGSAGSCPRELCSSLTWATSCSGTIPLVEETLQYNMINTSPSRVEICLERSAQRWLHYAWVMRWGGVSSTKN